ncbi:MAG TPA: hypothetical protein DEA08_12985, partial [Planctomycetes bacterium]|nr:hypothetical protein [Planctomycetota bacterium]
MKHSLACALTLLTLSLIASGCTKKRSSSFASTVASATSTSTTTVNTSTASSTTSGSGASTASSAVPTQPATPTISSGNTGTGVFIDGSASLPASSSDDFALAFGDFDGDNDLDVFIGGYEVPGRILRNEGGTFVLADAAFPSVSMKATDAHAVDIDGDGDLDLIVSSNFQPIRVFRNDGGTFSAAAELAQNNDALTYKLAVGDVDGDGDPDVFMANAGQGVPSRGLNRLFLNDGGTFSEAPAGMLPEQRQDSVAGLLVDVDDDKDLDLFVGNFGVGHRLLLNDGTGTFTDQSDALLPALVSYGTAAVAADFDKDGFVDIFLCNEGAPGANGVRPNGEQNVLLRGGASGFTDATASLPVSDDASFGVSVLDADGDGWL